MSWVENFLKFEDFSCSIQINLVHERLGEKHFIEKNKSGLKKYSNNTPEIPYTYYFIKYI
jgi:hypothetical protein